MTTLRRASIQTVVQGQIVPDLSGLDGPTVLARKREVERQLAATRGDESKLAERERLRAEDAALSQRLTEIKEQTKRDNTRRNFAGIGSPLHEAIVAKLDAAIVAELEADALERLAERERRSAERKARRPGGAP
ncbi:MAG TPA: hypothetical protein VFQ61_36310 [Polyangiaceae bacterium]|nr:hypothetical protein [Polyangiaceae bacterium]